MQMIDDARKKNAEIFLPKASKFLFRPQSEKISENFPDCE